MQNNIKKWKYRKTSLLVPRVQTFSKANLNRIKLPETLNQYNSFDKEIEKVKFCFVFSRIVFPFILIYGIKMIYFW